MINKRNKRLQASLHGGLGAEVIDGDLPLAIRIWKQDLKRSGILLELFERRAYTKPSRKRKDIMSRAKHKQQVISKLEQ